MKFYKVTVDTMTYLMAGQREADVLSELLQHRYEQGSGVDFSMGIWVEEALYMLDKNSSLRVDEVPKEEFAKYKFMCESDGRGAFLDPQPGDEEGNGFYQSPKDRVEECMGDNDQQRAVVLSEWDY